MSRIDFDLSLLSLIMCLRSSDLSSKSGSPFRCSLFSACHIYLGAYILFHT